MNNEELLASNQIKMDHRLTHWITTHDRMYWNRMNAICSQVLENRRQGWKPRNDGEMRSAEVISFLLLNHDGESVENLAGRLLHKAKDRLSSIGVKLDEI